MLVVIFYFFVRIAVICYRTKFIQLQSNYGEVIETPTVIEESDNVFCISVLKHCKLNYTGFPVDKTI